MNVPNTITLSRLFLVAPFAYVLFAGYSRWTALAVFALAAVTDLFDGLVARRLGQVTPGGAWLDQMVDRSFTLAIVLLLLTHGWLAGGVPPRAGASLPLLLALACARELVALPGVLIVLLRRARLYHVEYVGKVATFVQSLTMGTIILDVPWALYPALGCAVIGVFSGANYLQYSVGAPSRRTADTS
jgi:CDP-diacylglycerol--glycerol-3-phosphate 3-phosphatidyltransferase